MIVRIRAVKGNKRDFMGVCVCVGGGGGGGGGKLFYDLQACSGSRLITDYPILVPRAHHHFGLRQGSIPYLPVLFYELFYRVIV